MDPEVGSLLARYPALCRPVAPPQALPAGEGLSGSRFHRFESGRGPLVLHGWPPGGMGIARLRAIHEWMGRAAHLGFVPEILEDLEGRKIQEGREVLWELMTWRLGWPDRGSPPPAGRVRAAFAALAALHQALAPAVEVEGPSPGVARRVAELRRLIGGEFEVLRAAVAARTAQSCAGLAGAHLERASKVAPAILSGLEAVLPVHVALQPCLRDVRAEHVLFTGDRVTGLIDFGAMDVDTVATDLARLLDDWALDAGASREAALDSYGEHRPLSARELALIPAFESCSGLLGGCHWIRWVFVEGRELPPGAVAARLERATARMNHASGLRLRY